MANDCTPLNKILLPEAPRSAPRDYQTGPDLVIQGQRYDARKVQELGGEAPADAASRGEIYAIKPGDTLRGIYRRAKEANGEAWAKAVPYEKFAEANRHLPNNGDTLYPDGTRGKRWQVVIPRAEDLCTAPPAADRLVREPPPAELRRQIQGATRPPEEQGTYPIPPCYRPAPFGQGIIESKPKPKESEPEIDPLFNTDLLPGPFMA
jgi:hypothetical protein